MSKYRETFYDEYVPLEIAIDFCADEGILNNLLRKEKGFSINSPFVPDKKRRCYINYSPTNSGREYLAFKDFIATGKLDPDLYQGSFFKFVKLIRNMSSVEEAYFYIMIKYLRGYDFSKAKTSVKVYEQKALDIRHFEPLMITAHGKYLSYLKTRGISWDLISKYKVFIDKDQERIVFPVYENGIPIYYNGRSIYSWMPKEFRWIKSEVEHTVYAMWNLENVGKDIWLFEGIFDGIFWPDKAAAYFGGVLSKELAKKIKNKNPERVVFIGQNPYIDEVSKTQRTKILERLKDQKLNVALFDWHDIKEKDMNEAIVNKSLKIEDVEKRIVPYDDKAKVMMELEAI